MWTRLRSLFAREESKRVDSGTLFGAPEHARVKRYTAMSGYVYEYTYRGYREDGAERVHVFNVSADRKAWFDVEVTAPDQALAEWEVANARILNPTERYAVAKLALFHAFDERERPEEMTSGVRVDAAAIGGLLESIDF